MDEEQKSNDTIVRTTEIMAYLTILICFIFAILFLKRIDTEGVFYSIFGMGLATYYLSNINKAGETQ